MTNDGCSKLAEAFGQQDQGMLRQAISDGEDVNSLIDDGFGNLFTALSVASMIENEDMAEVLIKAGASPNKLNGDGTTALTWSSSAAMASLMLAQGAKVSEEKPVNGRTSVHLAALRGNVEILKELLACDGNQSFGVADFMANSPLGCAAMKGMLESVKLLLDSGHDPNVAYDTPPSMSPLQWALVEGHREVAEELLKRGADPELARGMSPLPSALLKEL